MRSHNIIIPDTFYEIYSFTHDFGYSSDEEILRIINILDEVGYEHDDDIVLTTLNHIKKIALKINNNYQKEYISYKSWRDEQRYIGGNSPILIELARDIVVAIIVKCSVEILTLHVKKPDKNDPMSKLLEKMEVEDEDLIYEVKTTYTLKRTKKDSNQK